MTGRRLLAVLLFVLGLAPAASADDAGGVIVGYGQAYQKRQGFESTAHLGTVGYAGALGDDLILIADFQFGIDSEESDLTHLSLSMVAGYAIGPSAFTFWLGGGLRFALDGYPNPSAALYDPGLGAGFLSQFGGFGFGADVRGWLGLNFYCDRASGDIEFGLDPYLEWRAYVSIGGF